MLLMFFCRFSGLSNPYVLCYYQNYLLIKTSEYLLVPHVPMGRFTMAVNSAKFRTVMGLQSAKMISSAWR